MVALKGQIWVLSIMASADADIHNSMLGGVISIGKQACCTGKQGESPMLGLETIKATNIIDHAGLLPFSVHARHQT